MSTISQWNLLGYKTSSASRRALADARCPPPWMYVCIFVSSKKRWEIEEKKRPIKKRYYTANCTSSSKTSYQCPTLKFVLYKHHYCCCQFYYYYHHHFDCWSSGHCHSKRDSWSPMPIGAEVEYVIPLQMAVILDKNHNADVVVDAISRVVGRLVEVVQIPILLEQETVATVTTTSFFKSQKVRDSSLSSTGRKLRESLLVAGLVVL